MLKLDTALMYTYVGKLNYAPFSDDDTFVMIFPQGFVFGADVLMYHQWTHNANGVAKATSSSIAKIRTISDVGGLKVEVREYYGWDVSVSEDKKELSVKMLSPSGGSLADLKLELHYESA
ncbi:hypothetical protein ONZ45_g4425 [Pleurotus djamor]|nr:hypothetical protein ONZ45_g4425 [Pleurotus djamor]